MCPPSAKRFPSPAPPTCRVENEVNDPLTRKLNNVPDVLEMKAFPSTVNPLFTGMLEANRVDMIELDPIVRRPASCTVPELKDNLLMPLTSLKRSVPPLKLTLLVLLMLRVLVM